MNKIMMANLKMNLNKEEMDNYKKVIENSGINDFIICPSNIFLSTMISSSYTLCAQDAYYEDKGAFTGQTSFYQLSTLGINYSLIGHSERRHVFYEDNNVISLKMQSCVRNNITPVLCVGETKEERENGKTNFVVEEQLKTALSGISMSELTVAYEPVWAIGTGLVPTLEEIDEVHLYIKKYLSSLNINSKVLYGGSVKSDNIKEITNISSVDGVLIGGASNNPENLINMYKLIN